MGRSNCIQVYQLILSYLVYALTAVLFSGCLGIGQINRITSPNLHYSDFINKNKVLRFAEMNMVGKKRFYENASRLVELSKNEGYALFYEHLDFQHTSDTIKRKFRRMYSILPDSQGFSGIVNLVADNGFIVQNDSFILHKGNGPDTTIDRTPAELVLAYEQEFGEIRLKKMDFNTPLNQPLYRLASFRKSDRILIDYRNKLLAEEVHRSDYNKIIIAYGARHRKGFFRELQQLDSTYINTGRKSTAKDERFDHSLSPDTSRILVQKGWIEKMSTHIGIKLSFDNDIESFFVDTDDLDFEIEPNTSSKTRLSFNYRFISFSYSYSPKFLPGNDDDDEKGNTKSFGLGLNLVSKHWFQGISYKKTKGYYIKNTNELDPSWEPGDPYFQSPDLVYQAFEGVTGYSFNKKFSVSALTSQTERQLKSAGTFTSQLHYRYYSIDDQKELTATASSQKSTNFELIGGAGYHHTFVIRKNWYLNAGAEAGAGYMNSSITLRGFQTGTSDQNNFIFRWDARAGAGYNGKHFFAGGLATTTGSSFRQENTTAVNLETRIYYQVFAGYRFSAPKFIRERFE